MTIIYWTVSWLSGIWLASTVHVTWFFWPVLVGLGTLCAIALRQRPHYRLISICLIIAGLGAVRYSLAAAPPAANHISNLNGIGNIIFTGMVASEPDIRDFSTNLLVKAESVIMDDGSEQPVSGKVLLYVPRYPEIDYGSRLRINGQLQTPVNSSGFDYQQYLARKGIYSEMNRPEVVVLETGLGNPLTTVLLAIKDRAQDSINHLFSEPQAALLSGILLGYDHGLPQELAEDFRTTGMTHIIAISGFNIAIVAGILLLGSRYFASNRLAAIIALVGITLYTILVGAEASVVRAAIMGAFFIIALHFLGRPTFLPAALFAAALFMTLVNPYILWDIGFQLSFVAVLGLILYIGPWSRWISGKLEPHLGLDKTRRTTHMIADIFLATIAATMMTLPLILFHFDALSLISPLANLMILPAQPGVMIVGGLATILGMISPVLGQVPAWAAWLLLTYTINLVRFFADFPYSSIPLSISAGGVIVFYALIMGTTWFAGLKKEKRLDIVGRSGMSRTIRAAASVGIITALLVGFWAWNQPDGKLHVVFLDVGQGDAIFIESPDGRQVLIDGGRYPSLFLDRLGREMAFWDKDIDIVVATHPDEDHIMGLVEALNRFQVGLLLVNGEKQSESPGYEALLQAADDAQIPVHRAVAGEVIALGDGTNLEILHPGLELEFENRNDNSIAMRLVHGDFAVLLTGDAEGKAEKIMMEGGRPLGSAVFKAGHHGSRSSSSRSFLQAVKPQIIVISAGRENRYDHPHPEVLQRAEEIGATILRTDEMGSIEIISDGGQIWWEVDE